MEGECGKIEHRAYARVGLLGNPSDAYFGKTISFSLANFWATVWLQPSAKICIVPHPLHDPTEFVSLSHLAERVGEEGYYGGVRLLMAVCKVFHTYCSTGGIALHGENFTLSYETNIPRQAGLSGSSAIICAALKCLLEFYVVDEVIPVPDRPRIILSAEEEIGIMAGLQDRVVQVYGGLVYMEFDRDVMEKTGNGIYESLDLGLLPPLYLIYCKNPSDSGKVHSSVRKKWLEGDKYIKYLMSEVAQLAVKGRTALLECDYTEFAKIVNRNFDLRRCMFGDEVLGRVNIAMVDTARSVGAACKFTGSGGAVVAFCPGGTPQVNELRQACKIAGFTLELCSLGPSWIKADHH